MPPLRLWAALVLFGCAAPQKPHRFAIGAQADPIAAITRALAVIGHLAETTDPASGVITTRWVDTGFMYGSIGQQTATINRRYVIVVAPVSTGSQIDVRADVKKCVQGNPEVCEAIEGLVPKHQEELDAFAANLQKSVVGQ